MSAYTVARDDFRNVSRSYAVLGVAGAFAGIVALAFAGSSDVHGAGVRTLWDFTALVAWVFPLFVAPLTYLAVAGDRSRGTIAYYLGLPNSRAEYVLAKCVTRGGVAAGAILSAVAVGFVIAATTYPDGADPGRFAAFGALSALYALAIAGAFVAVSAATATRTRAMFGVLGAYFVLSAFWTAPLPVANLDAVLAALTDRIGVELSEGAKGLIGAASPTGAYLNSLRFVFADVVGEYEVFAAYDDLPDALAYEPWFNVLVLCAWAVVAPLVGYLRFERAELG